MTIPRISPYGMPPREAWPRSRAVFDFDPTRAALLVHDLQQYFLDYYDSRSEPLLPLITNVSMLIESCRQAGVPIVYTCQPSVQSREERGLLNSMWGPGLNAAPGRAEIIPSLAPRSGDTVLVKRRYSAFQKTELLALLQQWRRQQLVICGVYAHIGCLATALEAFMNDLEVFFVGDAVADFSQQNHRLALDHVADCCGTLVSCDALGEVLAGARRRPALSTEPDAPAAAGRASKTHAGIER